MTPMDRADIDKLRELPIEGVAERLGLNVKRHHCLCPFHGDRTPSLSFSVKRNTYRCWSCSARGDPIDLVRNYLNKSFVEACQWLADENAIIFSEYKPERPMTQPTKFHADFYSFLIGNLPLGSLAQDFLFNERKYKRDVVSRLDIKSVECSGRRLIDFLRQRFTEEQLQEYGIVSGQADRKHCFFWSPCLLIPYFSVDGSLEGIQSRYLGTRMRFNTAEAQAKHDAIAAKAPRFQFSPGSHPMIFNLPVLKDLKPDEELWITEGVSDCIGVMSSGRKAIAIPSATLLTSKNKVLLASAPTRNWHIAPDQDQAGETLFQAIEATANETGAKLTRHQLPEGCKDFSEYWKRR